MDRIIAVLFFLSPITQPATQSEISLERHLLGAAALRDEFFCFSPCLKFLGFLFDLCVVTLWVLW